MESVIYFSFIVVLPLILVAGAPITLFALGAFFDAADHPDELRSRIEGLFHPSTAPARQTAADHYYRPHWREN
jgi:hypothetical protein